MKQIKICVIVPMYNEAMGAKRCIRALMKQPLDVIAVNDGSHDQTLKILKAQKKIFGNRLHIVDLKINSGYGGALCAGVKEALQRKFEFGLFIDSDLTNDPHDIPRFIKALQPGVDAVKATRYECGGKMIGVPCYRQRISRLGNLIARLGFRLGVSDCTNGFRLVRLSLLTGHTWRERGFAQIMEELYLLKQKKARVVNLPVTLTARQKSASHFTYKFRTFFEYGKYVIKAALWF